nr:GFA family protein [uncultured Cohaesibacter sp.]
MEDMLTGRCLCGAVEFEFPGHANPMVMCHCKQCRQWGGHAWPSITIQFSNLEIKKGRETLTWYESSEFARRCFCSKCGSSLFWHADRHPEWKDEIAVSVGCIDDVQGRRLTKHIFASHKGDYYDITDTLPQEDD